MGEYNNKSISVNSHGIKLQLNRDDQHAMKNKHLMNMKTCLVTTHCKNRLVVLTGEWLPWLHGLLCTIGQLYKTTSFLVVSSSFLCSEMRKSGGNNEETTSLVVLYNYQTKT